MSQFTQPGIIFSKEAGELYALKCQDLEAKERELADAKRELARAQHFRGIQLPGTFGCCMSGHYYAMTRGDEECPICKRLAESKAECTDLKMRLTLMPNVEDVAFMSEENTRLRDLLTVTAYNAILKAIELIRKYEEAQGFSIESMTLREISIAGAAIEKELKS